MAQVLIVDDEPNILLSLEFLMQRSGFQVLTAATGAQAGEHLEASHPDIVLLDISLPDTSGFELLEEIRANPACTSLPVIMLTAHGREVEKEKGIALGANDYVTKPFSTQELVTRVQSLLAQIPDGD